MSNYQTQIETIRANAIKDIEAYMADKTEVKIDPKVGYSLIYKIGKVIFVKIISPYALNSLEDDEVAKLADYINSIDDK